MRSLGLCLLLVACSGPTLGDSEWEELAGMRVARSEHPAVVFSGEILVFGGLVTTGIGRTSVTADAEAYDPDTNSWRDLPDLPAPRHHLMAAVVGDRVFVIGGHSEEGFTPVDDVWELVEGAWERRASLPMPVGAGAAAVHDGVVYVVGGVPDGGLFMYDPEVDRWSVGAAPSEQREHLAAVAFQGEVWAIGGRWEGRISSSTEIYEPSTDVWRAGPELNEARSGFGASVLDGAVYVAGGEVFDPDRALDVVERLGDDGIWVESDPLPFGLHGNPLVSVGDHLYVPGGSVRAGGVDNPGTMLGYQP